MRACVQYAIDYPDRRAATISALDLFKVATLNFKKPATDTFPLLDLARQAITLGGGMGAVINAADEVAVDAFLHGRLSFVGISEVISQTFEKMISCKACSTLEELLEIDKEARQICLSLIKE